jgi:predicted nucleotide-binding protein (sugar kinase/HSP70/actin superfamily)
MDNKTYIVAGNYQEFFSYNKDKKNQLYVDDINKLYGQYKIDVKLIGTYYRRKDWNDINIFLKLIEANIIEDK